MKTFQSLASLSEGSVVCRLEIPAPVSSSISHREPPFLVRVVLLIWLPPFSQQWSRPTYVISSAIEHLL